MAGLNKDAHPLEAWRHGHSSCRSRLALRPQSTRERPCWYRLSHRRPIIDNHDQENDSAAAPAWMKFAPLLSSAQQSN